MGGPLGTKLLESFLERADGQAQSHLSRADGTSVILYLVELLDLQPVLRSCFLSAPERPLLLHLLQLLVQSAENHLGGQSQEILGLVERWRWILRVPSGSFILLRLPLSCCGGIKRKQPINAPNTRGGFSTDGT